VVSAEDDTAVAVSDDGRYVAFPPEQKRRSFSMFKKMDGSELVRLVGLREGDTLVTVYDDGEVVESDDLKVTRPNVAPKPLRYRNTSKVTRVFVDKPNHFFVNSNGTELGTTELGTYEDVFQIGPNNLVLLEDGKRAFQNADDAYETIKKTGKSVKLVIPFR